MFGETTKMTKEHFSDILMVDNPQHIMWNYEPMNFKVGDTVICLIGGENNYVKEKVVQGERYKVSFYDKGNLYRKGYLQICGCEVLWDDDRFELVSENETIDVEYIDVTNQKK